MIKIDDESRKYGTNLIDVYGIGGGPQTAFC